MRFTIMLVLSSVSYCSFAADSHKPVDEHGKPGLHCFSIESHREWLDGFKVNQVGEISCQREHLGGDQYRFVCTMPVRIKQLERTTEMCRTTDYNFWWNTKVPLPVPQKFIWRQRARSIGVAGECFNIQGFKESVESFTDPEKTDVAAYAGLLQNGLNAALFLNDEDKVKSKALGIQEILRGLKKDGSEARICDFRFYE